MPTNHDCVQVDNLKPQPPSKPETKEKSISPKEELALTQTRLLQIRKTMKDIKEQIATYATLLQKELGENVDIPALARQGQGPGWQGRVQELLILRLKLTAFRSKFLEGSHKQFYRGPFNPNKEFDLKQLPQKQESLYGSLLSEKKREMEHQKNPIAALRKELEELGLMYRASRFRNKSLVKKVDSSRRKLEKSKAKADDDAKMIEYMVLHESLTKLALDPETLQLDPTLKRHSKGEDAPVSDALRNRTLFAKTTREREAFEGTVRVLAEKLDRVFRYLIEAEQSRVENECQIAALKYPAETEKSPAKGKAQKGKGESLPQSSPENDELKLITEENKRLRTFLFSSALTHEEDFKLFLSSLKNSREQFDECFRVKRKGSSRE